jgi:hypothetical protein
MVDQFEEIFPFRDRKLRDGVGSEADLFVSYLLRAAQDQAGRIYVILTMRSDYLGECAKFPGLPEALNDGQYLVPRLTRQQLQEAIEGPATAAGVEVHPVLVQDLLNQCDEEPDNLPLLQHLLRRIFEEWEHEGEKGAITPTLAMRVGGLARALHQDAETVYRGLSPDEQQIAEVLFRRITESRRGDREDGHRPVRRPQTVADLAKLVRVSEPALRKIASAFEKQGLLVVRTTDEGDKVDLPHECMCWKWERLNQWSSASPGLPLTRNGTSVSVTVGGVTTQPPLYYTSATQLAAVLPSTTPLGTGSIIVTNNGQPSDAAPTQVVQSAFGIDTTSGTGPG